MKWSPYVVGEPENIDNPFGPARLHHLAVAFYQWGEGGGIAHFKLD